MANQVYIGLVRRSGKQDTLNLTHNQFQGTLSKDCLRMSNQFSSNSKSNKQMESAEPLPKYQLSRNVPGSLIKKKKNYLDSINRQMEQSSRAIQQQEQESTLKHQ